jgi:hypothetical protein
MKYTPTPGKAPPLALHIAVSPSTPHDTASTGGTSVKGLDSVLVGFEDGTSTSRSIGESATSTPSKYRKRICRRMGHSDSKDHDYSELSTARSYNSRPDSHHEFSTPTGSRAGSRRNSWKNARTKSSDSLGGSAGLHTCSGDISTGASFSLHFPDGNDNGAFSIHSRPSSTNSKSNATTHSPVSDSSPIDSNHSGSPSTARVHPSSSWSKPSSHLPPPLSPLVSVDLQSCDGFTDSAAIGGGDGGGAQTTSCKSERSAHTISYSVTGGERSLETVDEVPLTPSTVTDRRKNGDDDGVSTTGGASATTQDIIQSVFDDDF